MKIRKLGIKSFGKFKDKEIKFEDGLNVIYGNNEAGKSTAHKFIQGVFFGFFKPYSKNKIYSYERARTYIDRQDRNRSGIAGRNRRCIGR